MTPFSPVGSLTCLRTGLGSIIYIFGSLYSIWSAPYGVCDLTNQVSGNRSCEPHPPFWEQWTSLNMALSRIHRGFQACRSGLGALASTGGLLRGNRPSHVPARTLFGRDRDRPKASHSRVLTGTEGQLRNLFEIQGEIFSLSLLSLLTLRLLLSFLCWPFSASSQARVHGGVPAIDRGTTGAGLGRLWDPRETSWKLDNYNRHPARSSKWGNHSNPGFPFQACSFGENARQHLEWEFLVQGCYTHIYTHTATHARTHMHTPLPPSLTSRHQLTSGSTQDLTKLKKQPLNWTATRSVSLPSYQTHSTSLLCFVAAMEWVWEVPQQNDHFSKSPDRSTVCFLGSC